MTNPAVQRQSLLVLVIALFVVLFVTVIFIVNFWYPFMKHRKYLKMEIRRSDGKEKRYYERQLKLFYVSHIPIVRRFIFKREEKRKHRENS